MTRRPPLALWLFFLCLPGCTMSGGHALRYVILPEQTELAVRQPDALPSSPLPDLPTPRTVSHPQPGVVEWPLSLDEAIRIALENAKVIRVLTGVTSASSGRTIYDVAIANATIDQFQAAFDPQFFWRNTYNRTETPFASFDPVNPGLSLISGSSTNDYRLALGLTKTNVLGGQWSLTDTQSPTRVRNVPPGSLPLNPQNRSAFELSYTQPLLQGGGFAVNTAPVVIARIDTERSFFQYKDSVQEMVRGVIEAYWQLVQARVEVFARQIQAELSEEAYRRAEARKKVGLAALGEVAQARVTYNQFLAALIASRANLLTREGALRSILSLPPEDHRQIIPVSSPTSQRLPYDWTEILRLAEQQRPDIIELKLVIEADQARLVQADNLALPRLDATTLYRWNGLYGEMPNGQRLESESGQFTDWALGINFSVPLGLRDGRARVRQQKLLIARDIANLEQQVQQVAHNLAINIRDLDSAFDQYLALKETRAAALENLKVQIEEFRAGRTIYLNVLQALNDWGNAVTSEAQALISYNVLLATLERQTGTILETHGLVFHEERFRFAGPFGACGHGRLYPGSVRTGGAPTRYPGGPRPGEQTFDLQKPQLRPLPPAGEDKTKTKKAD